MLGISNKKILLIGFLSVVVLSLTLSFGFALGQTDPPPNKDAGLVPCGNIERGQEECNFGHFHVLIKKIINFCIMIAIPLAGISIAIAGFMFMVSGDNAEKRTKARGIIMWAVVGVALVLGAWLIINAILQGLTKEKFQKKDPLKESLKYEIVEYYA